MIRMLLLPRVIINPGPLASVSFRRAGVYLAFMICLSWMGCDSPGSPSSTSSAAGGSRVNKRIKWPEPERDKNGWSIPPEVVERRPLVAEIHELVAAENFSGLEAMFAEGRRAGRVLMDGGPILSLYYDSIVSYFSADEKPVEEAGGFYKKWAAAHGDSPVPLTLLGAWHIGRAWDSRGGGWGEEVTPEGRAGFEKELERAEGVLLRATKLSTRDAELYAQLITVGMGKSYPTRKVREMFEEGFDIDPGYLPLYSRFMTYLLPRWHGGPGELEAFAAEMADRIGGDRGAAMYARIAYMTRAYVGAEELHGDHEFEWARVSRGYAALHRLHPECPKFYAQEVEMAHAIGDQKTVSRAATALGPMWTHYYLRDRWIVETLNRYDPRTLALRVAAKQHDWEKVDELLSKRNKIDELGIRGVSALHRATEDGDAEQIRGLISRGANPNLLSTEGWAPLTNAAFYGKMEAAEALLSGGANPNLPPGDRSPLYQAVEGDKPEMVQLLLANGADPGYGLKDGFSPLHFAASSGRLEAARAILLHGADINMESAAGSPPDSALVGTPLHRAIEAKDAKMLELLLSFGADPNVLNGKGSTPLDVAKAAGDAELIALLEAAVP